QRFSSDRRHHFAISLAWGRPSLFVPKKCAFRSSVSPVADRTYDINWFYPVDKWEIFQLKQYLLTLITDFSLWITNIAAGIAKLPELPKRPQYQEGTSLAHPTARPCPSQYGLPGSSRSPLTSAAGGRNAVIRAAAYRLVMRNTSRGPRCVRRSVHDWGNDSNRLGRSGMRLVGCGTVYLAAKMLTRRLGRTSDTWR